MDALKTIEQEKIAAIIRLDNSKSIDAVVDSLYEGGVRVLEVTLNTPDAFEAIEKISVKYPDLTVGAGTVLDADTAQKAIHHGAGFLLSPILDEDVISAGVKNGVPVIPGVFTPTEAVKAYQYGAKLVKVFPAGQLTPRYIKDLKGPAPFLEGMAVGGVSADNLQDYFTNGWHSVGVGSTLVNPVWIEQGEFSKIKKQAEDLIAIRNQVFST